MARSVWKYPLEIGSTAIDMPKDAKILHVASQKDTVCLWVEVDTTKVFSKDDERESRFFWTHGTGHEIVRDKETYVGTAITHGGTFVWHVYETTNC